MILFLSFPILLFCGIKLNLLVHDDTINWKVKAGLVLVLSATILFILTIAHNTWSYTMIVLADFDIYYQCKASFSVLFLASQVELVPLVIYGMSVYNSINNGANKLSFKLILPMVLLSSFMFSAYVSTGEFKKFAISPVEDTCFQVNPDPPFIGSWAMTAPFNIIFFTSLIIFAVRTNIYINRKKKITKNCKIYAVTINILAYLLLGMLVIIVHTYFPASEFLYPIKRRASTSLHYKNILLLTKVAFVVIYFFMLGFVKDIRDNILNLVLSIGDMGTPAE